MSRLPVVFRRGCFPWRSPGFMPRIATWRVTIKAGISMPTLREIVDEHVREGELYEKLDRSRVRCYACGHCCPIPEGQPGVCKVRFNRGGTLYVPWGYVGGVQCDPIEKKPFFHVR